MWIPSSSWYRHTRKRNRQIATGAIPIPTGAKAVAPAQSRSKRARSISDELQGQQANKQPRTNPTPPATDVIPPQQQPQPQPPRRQLSPRERLGVPPDRGASVEHEPGFRAPGYEEPEVEVVPPEELQGGMDGNAEGRGDSEPGNQPQSGDSDHPGPHSGPRRKDLDLPTSSPVKLLDDTLKNIHKMRKATLKESQLDDDSFYRLQNPPQDPPSFTKDERHSIDLYMLHSGPQKYEGSCEADMRHHPEDKLLSHHDVKKKISEVTGTPPMLHDMCPDSCMAYTGIWEDAESCANEACKKPRWDPEQLKNGVKKPLAQFCTFPIGPQVQARWRSPDGAHDMGHREREMGRLLEELLGPEGLASLADIYHGTNFYKPYLRGEIGRDDFVLIYSMDGAQLFKHKTSSCWIYIWILVDVSPDKRYKKKYVLPGAIVPGPNKPKNPDSFNYPGFHHVSALANEGMLIYDGLRKRIFRSRPYVFLAETDAVAAPELHGWVPHGGRKGCRRRCGTVGRHKPNGSHYYAVSARPDGYNEAGCSHDDIEPSQLPPMQTEEQYVAELTRICQAPSSQYEKLRLELGIVKPSIILGIPRAHRSDIPDIFCGDIMHSCGLNITNHVQKLLRGILECDTDLGDMRSTWSWVKLVGDEWERHGRLVSGARKYLPGDIDRPSRNPCRKVKSGYKCVEFLVWIYGLAPAFLYDVLEFDDWKWLCKLAAGTRIIFQNEATYADLDRAHILLSDVKYDLEDRFAQHMISRMHFMPQCTHAITHHVNDYLRNGPLIGTSQFPIERAIGDLGAEIKQPSNAFGNLAEIATRRAHLNALKAMYPELAKERPIGGTQPHLRAECGHGATILHPRDERPRELHDVAQKDAILAWLSTDSVAGSEEAGRKCWEEEDGSFVKRWGRCVLRNGQIARSRLKECGKRGITRNSRNIKYKSEDGYHYAEVYFFFRIRVRGQLKCVALVSDYGNADEYLLEHSSGAVWAAEYRADAGLKVIEISSIVGVVGMIPHTFKTPVTGGLAKLMYFAFEKLGAIMRHAPGEDVEEEDKDDAELEDDDEEEEDEDEDEIMLM
ncbi:unnamed protein product [Peniophora sp. CBMAI 1063]|nr:unnamed protein product [Peniophora sp. CBMAI 1063]